MGAVVFNHRHENTGSTTGPAIGAATYPRRRRINTVMMHMLKTFTFLPLSLSLWRSLYSEVVHAVVKCRKRNAPGGYEERRRRENRSDEERREYPTRDASVDNSQVARRQRRQTSVSHPRFSRRLAFTSDIFRDALNMVSERPDAKRQTDKFPRSALRVSARVVQRVLSARSSAPNWPTCLNPPNFTVSYPRFFISG